MKKKFIKDPIYESYFWFVWDCNIHELHDWILKRFRYEVSISNSEEHLGKSVFIDDDKNGTQDFIIWINHKKNIPSLSHELLHLTFETMRKGGITLDENSEEAFTYLLTFYMREVMKCLKT